MPLDIPFYWVDAFAGRVFAGNPAAICPLDAWLPDATMQSIAFENNLAETAFFVPLEDGRFHLRWFTPALEIELCGHATVAAAWVVMNRLQPGLQEVMFDSRSGNLPVRRDGEMYELDFPSRPARRVPLPAGLVQALGAEPEECWTGERDFMLVYDSEARVRSISPDFAKLTAVDAFAVIVTAPGNNHDFVSRFFAPRAGINEDPVTGSAHCTLTPYWSGRLGKDSLRARQISARGGELVCTQRGDRVGIAGEATLYATGSFHLP
ncbi:MAG: PhzF family phenazine biosynthesis protein [Bryobacteraceae bacterium]|nr:PhzF family phenazine biosynthesis protein [Bryobacteraceae bacterium]